MSLSSFWQDSYGKVLSRGDVPNSQVFVCSPVIQSVMWDSTINRAKYGLFSTQSSNQNFTGSDYFFQNFTLLALRKSIPVHPVLVETTHLWKCYGPIGLYWWCSLRLIGRHTRVLRRISCLFDLDQDELQFHEINLQNSVRHVNCLCQFLSPSYGRWTGNSSLSG